MGHAAIPSRTVPRPTSKPTPGKPFKTHVILPGDLVRLVDKFADQMTRELPFEGKKTRTDAIRALLVEALKQRGIITTK